MAKTAATVETHDTRLESAHGELEALALEQVRILKEASAKAAALEARRTELSDQRRPLYDLFTTSFNASKRSPGKSPTPRSAALQRSNPLPNIAN